MFGSIKYNKNDFPITTYRTKKIPLTKSLKLRSFGEILFSSLTPEYERSLMNEIYGMRCVVGFTMDEILDMPVCDRRFFTLLHNERIEKENQAMEGKPQFADMQAQRDMVEQANARRNQDNKAVKQ